jgi:uncharacterized ParB-like nuclease family protein
MKITPIDEILATAGISPPALNCLKPNEDEYKVMCMQPHGHIVATSERVGSEDCDLASSSVEIGATPPMDTTSGSRPPV